MEADRTDRGILLSDLIQQLRRELWTSIRTADNEALRFKVQSVEVELQVTVSRESEINGGIRFWVVNLGGKYTRTGEDVHTIKLKLLPALGPQNKDVNIADETEHPSR
ncbi:hypothetical protein F0U61_11905 [Archangium violaceum]|uniref:trypco2 family protein n=1 Tax=Archangium violaceum TaxID=83451 RepID=UPI002B2E4D1E|nr:hypothetical protein F0U61_11905 [Archangium violaceum]